MMDLVPVEHDPFASGPSGGSFSAGGGFELAPVDHDPFAKAATPTKERESRTAREPGIAERMAIDLHNQRSAAAQGTTPNISAHTPNLVSDNVVEGDDGNYHYIDENGQTHPTNTNKHVILRDETDQRLKVYKRTEETDEGRASSLGRLLGTGMGAGNIEVTKGIPAIYGAAQRIGVDVARAIATQSPGARLAGQIAAKAPGGGPMLTAVEEGIKSLGGAAGRAGEMAGGLADTKAAGEAVTTGLEKGFKPQTKQLISDLYNRVDSLVDPRATAPLSNTQKIVADITARKQAYSAPGESINLGPAVEGVAGALRRPGGLTYDAIKNLRTEIGEKLKSKFLPPEINQQELQAIYGGLSKDLENAVQVTGGNRAMAAWKVANEQASARFDALKTLDKVIGPKSRSDEGVIDTLHRMAGSGKGADIETLSTARKALNAAPGAWQDVASTIIGRLGKDGAGNFSPARFVSDYNDLSSTGRRALFHGVGSGNVVPFLDDIAKVSQKYIDAGKLGNPSGSAGHAGGMALAGAVAAGIMHGSMTEPMAALGTVVGSNIAARILGAPATAASAARWTRAYDNLMRSPGPQSLAVFNMASRNLGSSTAAVIGKQALAPRLTDQIKGATRVGDERTNQ